VLITLEPYLSERTPPMGPVIARPMARGVVSMLAVSGS